MSGAHHLEHATTPPSCHGVFIDWFIFRSNFHEWNSRGSAMTNHKKLIWPRYFAEPELPSFHKRKGIPKIDRSVKYRDIGLVWELYATTHRLLIVYDSTRQKRYYYFKSFNNTVSSASLRCDYFRSRVLIIVFWLGDYSSPSRFTFKITVHVLIDWLGPGDQDLPRPPLSRITTIRPQLFKGWIALSNG